PPRHRKQQTRVQPADALLTVSAGPLPPCAHPECPRTIRRNDTTGELAYLRSYSPRPATLHTLVTVAGQRWRIEES
ncbi:hypothetical protein ABDZ15_21095, partial [Mycobacterium canetti]